MKKTNLIKVFLILLIGIMTVMFNTKVLAADNTGLNDLTSTINKNNTNTDNSNANTNNSNTNRNNANVNNSNTNRNNTNVNNSNTNIYGNSNLPQTGIEDSIPVALLVVVFGISAVYAYKKINEYKNI